VKIQVRRTAMTYLGITRYWNGALIYISLWRFVIVLDFRKDWIADMAKPKPSDGERKGSHGK
jgi:hypothetical protein